MAQDEFANYWDEALTAGIKRERQAQGMSQADLAERMTELGYRFHQSTINKIESGERKVTGAEAYGLAEVFLVSVDYLFDYAEAHGSPEARIKLIRTQADTILQSLLKLDDEAMRLRAVHKAFIYSIEAARALGIRYPRTAINDEMDLSEHYWPLLSLTIHDELLWRLRSEVWKGDFSELAGNVSGIVSLGDQDLYVEPREPFDQESIEGAAHIQKMIVDRNHG